MYDLIESILRNINIPYSGNFTNYTTWLNRVYFEFSFIFIKCKSDVRVCNEIFWSQIQRLDTININRNDDGRWSWRVPTVTERSGLKSLGSTRLKCGWFGRPRRSTESFLCQCYRMVWLWPVTHCSRPVQWHLAGSTPPTNKTNVNVNSYETIDSCWYTWIEDTAQLPDPIKTRFVPGWTRFLSKIHQNQIIQGNFFFNIHFLLIFPAKALEFQTFILSKKVSQMGHAFFFSDQSNE